MEILMKCYLNIKSINTEQKWQKKNINMTYFTPVSKVDNSQVH